MELLKHFIVKFVNDITSYGNICCTKICNLKQGLYIEVNVITNYLDDREHGIHKEFFNGYISHIEERFGGLYHGCFIFYKEIDGKNLVHNICMYLHGKRHGLRVEWDNTHIHSPMYLDNISSYLNDRRHGLCYEFHRGGLIAIYNYQYNKLFGRQVEYYINGNKKTEYYRDIDAKQCGIETNWRNNGKLLSKTEYF